MTRTALLLILFSFGVCFGQQVNVFKISQEFAKSAFKYEPPKLEPNVMYRDFFKSISKAIQNLINEVVVELFRQIRFQSYMMSNSALSVTDELQFELGNTNATFSNPYIDTVLKKLTSRLEAYLDLQPGSIGQGSMILPEIPEQGRVWSFISYHSLKQLFTHLETTVDLHLSNINVVIDSFYKKGWEGARYTLAAVQEDFRREYLNGYLLHLYNNVVKTVNMNADKIQKSVKPETWKTFDLYGKRIAHLFEVIKPSNQTMSRKRMLIFG